MKITPPNITHGPWRHHLGRGASPRFHIQTEAGYQIASTTELNGHKMALSENEQREANAKAIAAMHQLLAALADLVGRIHTAADHTESVKDLQGSHFVRQAEEALTLAGYTITP